MAEKVSLDGFLLVWIVMESGFAAVVFIAFVLRVIVNDKLITT